MLQNVDIPGIQWLGLCASTAGDTGLIPGWGTKISHVMWHDQKQNKTWQNVNIKALK